MPRRILAAAVSISILLPASSGPLPAQTVSQSVAVGAGRGVAPVPGSIGFGSGAQTIAPGLSTLAGPSLPSALIAAPRHQTRGGASAAAPFAVPAVQAGADVSFSAPAAPKAVPVLRNAAPAREGSRAAAASAEMEETSQGVSEAVEAAGPVEKAASESAHGLGRFLMRLLTGAREAAGSASVEASVRSQATTPRKAKSRARRAPAKATAGKSPAAALAASVSPAQRKMLQALDHVASLYTEHYAPIEWKQKQLGVDFKKEYQKARASILAKPDIKAREFQDILAAFVYATRDYHVSIQFYSTEKARLPLLILEAEGRYYIANIDRSKLSASEFPFEVGDEVVEFGGKPTEAVVSELAGKRPGNVPTTDRRIAQLHLTNRIRQAGESVPQGPVMLKIRDKAGALREAALRWDYTPEKIPSDAPVREGGLAAESGIDGLPGEVPFPGPAAKGIRGFISRLLPSMAHPLAELFSKRAKQEANGFMIGARESFVPDLGEILWEISKASPIRAYIYKDERGRKVGYIRIPDYMGEEQHAQIFAKIIQKFEKETEALVIDQVNNPGGSVFYMYALLSMLADKPFSVPKHRALIDESDAYWAAGVIEQAASQGLGAEMARELSEKLAGFKPARSPMEGVVEYARFLLSELRAGRRLTDPTHLFGVDSIEPNAMVRYTKPLVVLVNELDFSAGDFFPAILQDNKRATLLGVRTAGAGGGVKSVQFPNQLGIADLSYTWTLAERPDGRPIENLGVTPEREYKLTGEDFRTGFSGYKRAVNEAVTSLLPPPVPVALLPAPSVQEEPAKTVPVPDGKAAEPGPVTTSVWRYLTTQAHRVLSAFY